MPKKNSKNPILVRKQYKYKIDECIELLKKLPPEEKKWYLSFLRMHYGKSKSDAILLNTGLTDSVHADYYAESQDLMTFGFRKGKDLDGF